MIGSPEIPMLKDPVKAARYLKFGDPLISNDSPEPDEIEPKIIEYTKAEIELLGFIPKELKPWWRVLREKVLGF